MHLTAPLKNVTLFTEVLERAINAPDHIPSMTTFHGFSGYGKTVSAIRAANQYQALYLQAGFSWTQRSFCDSLLGELGVRMKGTINDKINKIIEQLIITGKPLIIDEFDLLVDKKIYNLVREIQDKTMIPTVLIGEELLIQKLEKDERFHNRIQEPFVAAVPADLQDARILSEMFCQDIHIEDDLLARIHKVSQGRPRRICVNLHHVREFAELQDLKTVSFDIFGADRLATGLSPARRAA